MSKYNLLKISRVQYGKKTTLEKDREYCTQPFAPVGTISEWKEHAKDKYDGLLITELDGSTHEVIF